MSRLNSPIRLLCFLVGVAVSCTASAEPPNINTHTLTIVTLGGVLNPDTDDTPVFTPDGKSAYFDRTIGSKKTIMVSQLVNGRWTPARIAPFSGHWYDQDPAISPDGSYLIFDSNRPTIKGGKPIVQDFFGQLGPGSNLWRVNRENTGWSKPVWLGPVLNNSTFVDFPSIARDGSLYFLRWAGGSVHIFRSQRSNGRYLPAVQVPLGNPTRSTHDPAIAPDGSFIVFDYGKTEHGLGRLSIAFKEGNRWSSPVDLGDGVNSHFPWGSRLSPNGRAVYFTGASHIWRLSLTSWLHRSHRK